MASITQPSEHAFTLPKVPNPSGGSITWDSTTGEYQLYLHAQKNAQGEVVVPAQKVSLKGLHAAILAVDYITLKGYKTDGKLGQRVSSPLYYVGTIDRRGKRWAQDFALWVGDDKTPAISGNWNDVKAYADANDGKFTRVWYILLTNGKMEQPFTIEFKGKELQKVGEAMSALGFKFENELTAGGIYSIELTGKTSYTIARNDFFEPELAIKPLGGHKDYARIYDAAVKVCQGIDKYTAYLVDKQYQYDEPQTAENTAAPTMPTAPPAFYPEPQEQFEPNTDDLPF